MNNGPVFLLGFVFGMILFCIVYGIRILNPCYDGWLFMDRDITQHYMGWLYYRASDWHFPVGLIDGLSSPYKVSIIYSDSIPLFAVFFKLISAILPETFQYFALYGILSFGLMGGFAAMLINGLTGRSLPAVAFSAVFVLSPYVLHRMYMHTALGGQWVILAAFYLWIGGRGEGEVCGLGRADFDGAGAGFVARKLEIKNLLLWTGLLFVTSGIHLYLVAMVYIICFGAMLEQFITYRKEKIKGLLFPVLTLFLSAAVVFFNLYILGAFYGGVSSGAGGFGEFEAPLTTFFDAGNPEFSCRIFPNLPEGYYQFEGYGYLGAGVILLTVIWLIDFIVKKRFKEISLRDRLFLIMSVGFFVWAAIPNITIQENLGKEESVRTVLSLHFPESVNNLLSILRCNGRFVWPVCYLLMLYSIVNILRKIPKNWEEISAEKVKDKLVKRGVLFVALTAFLLQLLDVSSAIYTIHTSQYFGQEFTAWYAREGECWDLILKDRPHVVYMQTDMERGTRLGYAIARKALAANGDVNTFYLARDLNEDVQVTIDEYRAELEAGNAREDVIYIFPADEVVPQKYNLSIYIINGAQVGILKDEPGLVGMEYVDLP